MNNRPQGTVTWVRRDWWLAGLLVVATLLAYQPAWRGAAVFDDHDHLTPPELQSLDGLGRIWTEVGVVSQYYPVTHSVFWLQQQLWGEAMLGYHVTNLLLHAGVALLLVRVLQQLALPGAWLAGALFALHPVHVESVAWISEQKNTLSTLFYLAAALAYLKFEDNRAPRSYAAALGWFLLALGAKTVVASLPAALLVVAWWRRGRLEWRRDGLPLGPFFLVGAAAGLFTAWIERRFIGAEGIDFALGAVERGLVAGRALWFYAGQVVWPVNLSFIHPRWSVSAAEWTQYLWPAAALAAVGAAWTWRQRTRGPLAAILLFAGTLFPVLGFLNVYPFVYSFVADHYQYLADVPAVAALAAGLAWAWRRNAAPRRQGALAAAAVLVGFAALTWRESRLYADAETLWRTTLRRNPAAFVAHSNLANCLFERGRTDEALRHARRALELKPKFAELHNNLGHFLFELGRNDEALACFRAAVELRPKLAAAQFSLAAALLRRGDGDGRAEAEEALQRAIAARPDFVKARITLAGLWIDAGRIDDALPQLDAALRVRPDDAAALFARGNAQLAQGRLPEAIASLRRSVAANASEPGAAHNLGIALWRNGETDEAARTFRQVIAAHPRFVPAQLQLGELLLALDRAPEAVAVLRQATTLAPTDAAALNTLGVALMQSGEPAAATESFRAAVRAQPDLAVARDNLALALQLAAGASNPGESK